MPTTEQVLGLGQPFQCPLRRFRNQIFHCQREYDNPKLLEFLKTGDADAQEATTWIRRTHAALGRATERALRDLVDPK